MADISITAANVVKVSGTAQTNIAGAAITAGQTIYIDTNQKAQLANAVTSATTALATGIALCNAALNQPVSWLAAGGDITIGGTVVAGVPYFLSLNNGGICPFADVGTGNRTMLVGIAKNTTDISVLMVTSSNQAVHA